MPAVRLHRLGRAPVEPLGCPFQPTDPEPLTSNQARHPVILYVVVILTAVAKRKLDFKCFFPCRSLHDNPTSIRRLDRVFPNRSTAWVCLLPVCNARLREDEEVAWLQPLGGP